MEPKTTQANHTTSLLKLYMALELHNTEWQLGFTIRSGQPPRLRKLKAGDLEGLMEEIDLSRKRFGLPRNGVVMSCYEAGQDGFWLHRFPIAQGVNNQVVDSASIEVNRRNDDWWEPVEGDIIT